MSDEMPGDVMLRRMFYNQYPPEERAILTDLIADLRGGVNDYPPDIFPDFTPDDPASSSDTVDRISGVAMRHAWTRAAELADRAEARLQEMS